MGEIIEEIGNYYVYIMDDLGDPRTKHLPLMSSPIIVILLLAAYLKFCTSIGPRLMKNRKPFDLRDILAYYNAFQVFLSIFLTYEGIPYLFSKDHSFVCDPIRKNTNNYIVNRVAVSSWWYFFAKMTELTETVFFVLRKKNKQVSTLHLYHHTMVLLVAWCATKFFPVGPIVLVGTLNSFVHIIMYSYYFVAGLGPEYQKYLWWKKHITLIQLIQFAIVISHNVTALFYNCNYPKLLHLVIIVNTSMLAYMFSKFYYYSYIKPKSKKTEELNGTTKLKEALQVKRKSITVGQ